MRILWRASYQSHDIFNVECLECHPNYGLIEVVVGTKQFFAKAMSLFLNSQPGCLLKRQELHHKIDGFLIQSFPWKSHFYFSYFLRKASSSFILIIYLPSSQSQKKNISLYLCFFKILSGNVKYYLSCVNSSDGKLRTILFIIHFIKPQKLTVAFFNFYGENYNYSDHYLWQFLQLRQLFVLRLRK